MKNQKGFTLIEVLVYLALFAILMGGMVIMAYNIFESSDRDQTKVLMQGEGDFLVSKINWALTGVKAMVTPLDTSGSILTVNKWIDSGVATTVDIRISGTDMVISRGGGVPIVLNNSNVQIENLLFTHNYNGANQEDVQASFTVISKTMNGVSVSQDFSTTKYMRK